MSFWDRNLAVLQQHYGDLSKELTTHNTDPDLEPDKIKIETASTGKPALSINGIYVHSMRDPEKEGQRLAQANIKENTGFSIILGFGLGYAAVAAAESGKPVVIIEKYKNLLKIAMENADLSDFLSKNRIIFVLGGAGENIAGALDIAAKLAGNKEEDCKPVVIRNRTLFDLDREWYETAEERIRTWSTRDKVNTATLNRFGGRWVRNLSRNMSTIRDYPGIGSLAGIAAKNSFSDPIPVFFAAAGPSLDKTAPLLAEIRKRCIIVTVDTSLRFFSHNGMHPDFVLTVDPQFWNSRHLDRCVYEHTVLIAESAVYPPALRLPFRSILLCGSLFPLGDFIEKQVDPKTRLGTGGSVATTAWDFAHFLGSDEYWIAGLDLAFPNLKTHFRGALFEERANTSSNRFKPCETWTSRALRDGFPFKAPSACGGNVLTDRRLFLYAAWFENRFSFHNKVKKSALFQEGLAIAGLEKGDAETLLSLPCRRDEINNRLENALSAINKNFYEEEKVKRRAECYKNAHNSLIRGLEGIKSAADKGASIAVQARAGNVNSVQQNKILKNIDEIMRRITDSDVKEVAGFLFPQFEEEKTESDAFRSYIKSSHNFFTSLAKTVEFNLKYLKY